MALINPIENEDHVQDWQQALGQYFKIVRVFNAMQADFEKVVAILEAFSHIREEWQSALAGIVSEYRRQRATQLEESASLLEELLTRLCTHQVSQKVLSKSQADGLKGMLEKKYFDDMRKIEHRHHEVTEASLSVSPPRKHDRRVAVGRQSVRYAKSGSCGG